MIISKILSFFKKNKKTNSKNNITEEPESESESELDEKIIQQIKLKVQERRELFQKMKSLYQPENDVKDSEIYYFLNGINSNKDLKKLSLEYLEDYQKRNNIKLPNLIIRLLSEIGSGKYINHHFLKNENELSNPLICLEEEFLNKCIAEGVSPKFIEDELYWSYDFEKNKFNHPQVQSIYESLNSERDKNITILFALGGHSSYITLNRENKNQVAVFDICGICNKPFTVDGVDYESPYFKYEEDDFKSSILGIINTHYWYSLLEKINTMNSKKKRRRMKYQVIEKEIYSGDDLLHFGEKLDYGDPINHHLPDYCGRSVGSSIFSTDQKEEAIEFKRKLELSRMKCMGEMVPAFFCHDEWAGDFFTSENFTTLVNFYKNEFDLNLIRKNYYEMTIEPTGFYLPSSASDEQVLYVQSLLGLSFFTIVEKE